MQAINDTEAWRIIPPEEKLELMARAHSAGLLSALAGILIGATTAIALHAPALLWISLTASPFIFQFSSSKSWRSSKPATMLQYLAARSAARRYAYGANSKELQLSLLFRGQLEQGLAESDSQARMERSIANNLKSQVWIALFEDAVVLMSEQLGGAQLEFSHILSNKVSLSSLEDPEQENIHQKELQIEYQDRVTKEQRSLKITSPYPVALTAFQKKFIGFQKNYIEQEQNKFDAFEVPESDDDDDDDNLML